MERGQFAAPNRSDKPEFPIKDSGKHRDRQMGRFAFAAQGIGTFPNHKYFPTPPNTAKTNRFLNRTKQPR
jgi:hypothetical protein